MEPQFLHLFIHADEPINFHSYTSASPLLSASNALTSVTYCSASSRGIKCSKSLSVGSLIQPSIGMALSAEVKSADRLHYRLVASNSHLREKYNSSDYCPKCTPGSGRAPRCSNLL